MIPKSIKLRSQNYRTPESLPEGICEGGGGGSVGRWGSIYEYGGGFKNADEAARQADLYMRRLQVENMRTEGMSRCTAFRAGRLAAVTPGVGDFLIVSVSHTGGINAVAGGADSGVYTYNNVFCCIDSSLKMHYAPPLLAVPPRTGGLITAPVEALGEEHPNLDEMGRYRVKLPFDVSETADYRATKDIRVSQPSGGNVGGRQYGIHFPSKQGAEMVMGYVDEDPNKPLGLGFVPNADAPSTVCCDNRDQNVIRSWGGNELVMDDTRGAEKITLSTPDKFENYDDRVKTWKKRLDKVLKELEYDEIEKKNSELLLDNEEQQVVLRAWMHKIVMRYHTEGCGIGLNTLSGHQIRMDDIGRKVAITTPGGNSITMADWEKVTSIVSAGDENSIVLDGGKRRIRVRTNAGNVMEMADKDNIITISNAKGTNSVVLDGGKGKISVRTKSGCLIEMDDEKDEITVKSANGANKVVMDGKGKAIGLESAGSISIKATENVNIKAGQDVIIAAEKDIGISGKNATIASKEMSIVKSDKRAAVKGKSGLNLTTSDAGGKVLAQAKGDAVVKGKMIKLN